MILKTLLDVIDLLESNNPLELLKRKIPKDIEYEEKKIGEVTYVKAYYKGGGKQRIEILGRLGAIQMKENKGLVSDADGAIVSLTALLELVNLMQKGIEFDIDISIITNISLNAKLISHKPFNFMVPLIDFNDALKEEVDPKADLILSIDSTKGNIIAKYDDFALTHVIKDGYILKLDDNVIEIYNRITGHEIYFIPLTTGDLTPIDFKVYHISTLVSPGYTQTHQ